MEVHWIDFIRPGKYSVIPFRILYDHNLFYDKFNCLRELKFIDERFALASVMDHLILTLDDVNQSHVEREFEICAKMYSWNQSYIIININ